MVLVTAMWPVVWVMIETNKINAKKKEQKMKRFPYKELTILGIVVIGFGLIYLWVLEQVGIV